MRKNLTIRFAGFFSAFCAAALAFSAAFEATAAPATGGVRSMPLKHNPTV